MKFYCLCKSSNNQGIRLHCISALIGLLVLLCFCSVSCNSQNRGIEHGWGGVGVPRRSDDIGSAGYRTSIGDAVDIFVLEDSTFNGTHIVRPSGDIILPKAGRIQVVNMTLSQVEAAIKKALESNQLIKATVIADPVRRGAGDGESISAGITIYLSGNVNKTGRIFVPFVGGGQVTALQAIMDSGGFSPFANKKHSYILRKDLTGQTARIGTDFSQIEKGLIPDVPLQDADMLVVPQKMIGF